MRGGGVLRAGTAALGLLLVLSGCGSKGGVVPPGETFIPLTAPPGSHDRKTCAIEGTVVDDEELPVPDAQVGLLAGTLNTTRTAQDGRFAFSFVTPGIHHMAATKDGFETSAASVTCEADSVADVLIPLKPTPAPRRPHAAILTPMSGLVACAAGVPLAGGSAAADYCTRYGLSANGQSAFNVSLENDTVTAFVIELAWTRTSGFGAEYLSLIYPAIPATKPVQYTSRGEHHPAGSRVAGPSPVAVKAETTDPTKAVLNGQRASLEVRAYSSTHQEFLADPTNDKSSLLVTEQPFKVYAAIFYNGEPVPADFTMLPTS